MFVRSWVLYSVGLSLLALGVIYPVGGPFAAPALMQPPMKVNAFRKRLAIIRQAHLDLRSLSGTVELRLRQGKDTLKFNGTFAFAKPNRAKVGFTVSGALKEMEFPVPANMKKNGYSPSSYTITAVSDGKAQYILSNPSGGKYIKRVALKGEDNIASVLDSALVGNAVTKMYLNADQIIPEDFEQGLSSARVTETVREGIPVSVFDLTATVPKGATETADRIQLVVGKKDNVVRELVMTGTAKGKPTQVAMTIKNLRVNPTLTASTFQFKRPYGLKAVELVTQ